MLHRTLDNQTLWIHIPSQSVIGDYVCRLGGSNYFLIRYVDP